MASDGAAEVVRARVGQLTLQRARVSERSADAWGNLAVAVHERLFPSQTLQMLGHIFHV